MFCFVADCDLVVSLWLIVLPFNLVDDWWLCFGHWFWLLFAWLGDFVGYFVGDFVGWYLKVGF